MALFSFEKQKQRDISATSLQLLFPCFFAFIGLFVAFKNTGGGRELMQKVTGANSILPITFTVTSWDITSCPQVIIGQSDGGELPKHS